VKVRSRSTVREGSAWTLTVQIEVASWLEAERVGDEIEFMARTPLRVGLHMPAIHSSMSDELQLAESVKFAMAHKASLAGRGLFAVLIALRTGVLRRSPNRWSGGVQLVEASKHEISKAEVSKAATVIAHELPHLLDRSVPVEDAVIQLAEWLESNDWWTAYDLHRDIRK
jgi:hypothetical protein